MTDTSLTPVSKQPHQTLLDRLKLQKSSPEAWVILPAKLTAENGAKSLLIGETFNGEAISWTAAKELYQKVVQDLGHPYEESISVKLLWELLGESGPCPDAMEVWSRLQQRLHPSSP